MSMTKQKGPWAMEQIDDSSKGIANGPQEANPVDGLTDTRRSREAILNVQIVVSCSIAEAETLGVSFMWVSPSQLNGQVSFDKFLSVARFVPPSVVFLEDLGLFG
jgi:hypothetical protein